MNVPLGELPPLKDRTRRYWNSIAGKYRSSIHVSTSDFHYGPLVPGDSKLKLLPPDLKSLRCLELGCGRAQNSVFLAKSGARCVASDLSDLQLEGAAELAKAENVDLQLVRSAMEDLGGAGLKAFDLIHSAYALDFCEDASAVLKTAFSLLKPGGTLLLSIGNPLFSGEWIELKNGDEGVFLKDYFRPAPDVRTNKRGEETVRSTFRSVAEMANLLVDAGFVLKKVLEPEACVPEKASPAELDRQVPYWSKGWLSYRKTLSRIPVVSVFKCLRP